MLRLLLSQYLGPAPHQIAFVTNPHGKPGVQQDPGAGGDQIRAEIHLNISHSGPCALFAFTHAGPVGVDIEKVRDEMPRQQEIADRYFAPSEALDIRNAPPAARANAFFRCWTRKEAFVKARGDGIFGGLAEFAVAGNVGEPRLMFIGSGASRLEDWTLADLPPVAGYVAAAAVAARDCGFYCWEARADGPFAYRLHHRR